jgi:hypothetical protein
LVALSLLFFRSHTSEQLSCLFNSSGCAPSIVFKAIEHPEIGSISRDKSVLAEALSWNGLLEEQGCFRLRVLIGSELIDNVEALVDDLSL